MKARFTRLLLCLLVVLVRRAETADKSGNSLPCTIPTTGTHQLPGATCPCAPEEVVRCTLQSTVVVDVTDDLTLTGKDPAQTNGILTSVVDAAVPADKHSHFRLFTVRGRMSVSFIKFENQFNEVAQGALFSVENGTFRTLCPGITDLSWMHPQGIPMVGKASCVLFSGESSNPQKKTVAGGAFYVTGSTALLELNIGTRLWKHRISSEAGKSTPTANAISRGGAVYLTDGATMVANGVKFDKNIAGSSGGSGSDWKGAGGAIFIHGDTSVVNLTDSFLYQNSAYHNGAGGIEIAGGSVVNVWSSRFELNQRLNAEGVSPPTPPGYAGGVASGNGQHPPGQLYFHDGDSSFVGNEGPFSGSSSNAWSDVDARLLACAPGRYYFSQSGGTTKWPGNGQSWASNNINPVACTELCEAGRYASTNAPRQKPCTSNFGPVCTPPPGAWGCPELCGVGHFCPAGSSLPVPCAGGKYTASGFANESTAESCSDCPAGRFSEAGHPGESCSPCPIGYAQIAQSSYYCSICLPGKYRSLGDNPESCRFCGSAEWQDQAGTDQCYTVEAGNERAPSGFQQFACGPGKYSSGGASSCEKCPPNTFTNVSGLSSCFSCGRGTKAEAGSAKCTSCDAGEAGTGTGGVCEKCVAGQFRTSNDLQTESCTLCRRGYYQNEHGQASCLPCIPGEHQPLTGQQSCQQCSTNAFTNTSGRSSCMPCGRGTKAEPGSAKCTSCDAGEAGTGDGGTCQQCAAGQSRASNDDTTASCTPCNTGYYQKDPGQASCLPCIPGEYQNVTGAESCHKCPENTFTNVSALSFCYSCGRGTKAEAGSAKCTSCDGGEAGTGTGGTCEQCAAGQSRKSNDKHTASCTPCDRGKYQKDKGQTTCYQCILGQHQPNQGSEQCLACAAGQYQDAPGSTRCEFPGDGAIVGPGRLTEISIAKGWHKIKCSLASDNKTIVCDSSAPCDAGTVSTMPPSETCNECSPGQTSFQGSTNCRPCAKGKFSAAAGQTCSLCPAGFFQPQENVRAIACLLCPIGWNQPQTGSTNCMDLGWKRGSDCNDDQYFDNTTLDDPATWHCSACPLGGNCRGDVAFSDVTARPGWWYIPPSHRGVGAVLDDENFTLSRSGDAETFARCLFAPSCLGGHSQNDTGSGHCAFALGFRNHSRLCQQCRPGYSRTGSSRFTCRKCDTASANEGTGSTEVLFGSGVILALAFYVGLVILRIKAFAKFNASRRRKALHSILKRILLTHMQMLSLIMSLKVPWPSLLTIVMSTFTSVINFSENVNTAECFSGSEEPTHADFFYGLLVFAAVFPLAMSLIVGLYWFGIAPRSRHLSCSTVPVGSKNVREIPVVATKIIEMEPSSDRDTGQSMTSTHRRNSSAMRKVIVAFVPSSADAWVSSMVLLWYLCLPSLLRIGFDMMQCQAVGTYTAQTFLRVDLTTPCWEEDHLFLSIGVAVPMLLVYGLIVPGGAMFVLSRAGKRRDVDPGLMLRWGLLHSGFRHDRFAWEALVLLRKILFILLETFVDRDSYQLHMALGILIVAVHLHDTHRPFGRYHVEGRQHGGASVRHVHRAEMWSLLVLLFLVWCAVFFSLGMCGDAGATDGICGLLVFLLLLSNFVYLVFLFSSCIKEFGKRKGLDRALERLVHNTFGRWSIVRPPPPPIAALGGGPSHRSGDGSGGATTKVEMMTNQMHGKKTTIELAEDMVTRHFDDASGRWYLHNHTTGESRWIEHGSRTEEPPPQQQHTVSLRKKKSLEDLRQGIALQHGEVDGGDEAWSVPTLDVVSGKMYQYHEETGRSRWCK